MRHKILIVSLPIVAVCIITFRTMIPPSTIVVKLFTGWVNYLVRVVPRTGFTWDGVLTGVVCLVLLIFGLHGFLRWLHGEICRQDGRTGDWRFRWTASIVALVVLMFASGIATVGIVHQTTWLLSSNRPPLTLKVVESHGDSTAHLKMIGMGLLSLERPSDELPDGHERNLQGWQTRILNFLPISPGGEIHQDLPWDDPRNSAYFRGVVVPYLNPEIGPIRDERGYALSHYAGNIHLLGPGRTFDPGAYPADTILAGEVATRFKPWGDPTYLRDPNLGINASPDGFGGPNGDGARFLFVDGSVRFLPKHIDPAELRRMSGADRPSGLSTETRPATRP